ncbi:MAG TPA: response regulator transcription factor [Dehalococcoidia bacterium]|nr:response regulator transcription factor [Dehalococcoidia bacterium]
MARRVIRHLRPSGTRVVRRSKRAAAPEAASAQQARPAEPERSPVLIATSKGVRNLILPKLSMMNDVSLAGLADSPESSFKMLVQERPEVVILDMDFGGDFIGLDTAKTMQKTKVRAAIVMLVPELDPEQLKPYARRFGSSWSDLKKTTSGRVDVLAMVLKSAVRGVQWIEPELIRPLQALCKVADEARDLEARRSTAEPAIVRSPSTIKNAQFGEPKTPVNSEDGELNLTEENPDEIAPGIKTQSTNEAETDDLKISSVSVGHGGVGQNVGKVRRTG